jgi:5-carboxymethyl-2-hydroxymuconate isomerase
MVEQEIVAMAIKDVLWKHADVSHSGSSPNHSVHLDDGKDAELRALIAETVIRALDQHRLENAEKRRVHLASELTGLAHNEGG